jgi:hypothetical protein
MGFFKKSLNVVLIWSAILIVGSLILFPMRFGINVSAGIFIYAIFEITYYLIVLFALKIRSTWLEIFQSAGLTFMYRITLGTVFGFLISVMYSMEISVALTIAISRYFPAILLQIIAAPLVMRAFYSGSVTAVSSRKNRQLAEKRSGTDFQSGRDVPARQNKPVRNVEKSMPMQKTGPDTSVGLDTNGFERAVRYLGEHHAVIMAAVIDHDGLTVSSFKRGDIDTELWAPAGLVLQDVNAQVLKKRTADYRPERLDLFFGGNKLVINKVFGNSLLVISQQEIDDLLGIRISQAIEIIKKYVSERYGTDEPSRAEEKYVSST